MLRAMDFRRGTTFLEIIIVVSLIVIFAGVSATFLLGQKNKSELDLTARQIAGLLREAQSRSMAQASSTGWGVHFENSTSTPFYALFGGAYNASTVTGYYRLPAGISYVSSTLSLGSSVEVVFSQIVGSAASTSIQIVRTSQSSVSSTISVSATGAVSY